LNEFYVKLFNFAFSFRTVQEKSQTFKFNVHECNTSMCVNVLEHVTLRIELHINVRSIKDIDIILTSPSNTTSFLLTKDTSNTDRENKPTVITWTFMSVHFWGELPNGTWTATVQTNAACKCRQVFFISYFRYFIVHHEIKTHETKTVFKII